jgi:hypothetical protein
MRAETGMFSRALSSGGVPLFLMSKLGGSDASEEATTTPPSAGMDTTGSNVEQKTLGDSTERPSGRPEMESGYVGKKSAVETSATSASKDVSMTAMFKRSTSAPAAPAFLLRRMPSSAQAPPIEVHEDASNHAVSSASPERGGSMLQTPAGASPPKRRIAPSRANAEKNDASVEPTRAQDASLPKDAHGGEPAAKQPSDAADQGFGRTGSAARVAAMGISRFRRAASQVLRVASAGKERQDGDAGQPQKDSLQAETKDSGIFGFRCVM